MKVRAFCAVLCLLLALSGLGWAHCRLSSDLLNVSFLEQPFTGDPAAAEGLQAELHLTSSGNRLLWETTLPLGRREENHFRFSAHPLMQLDKRQVSLMVSPAINSGWHTMGTPLDLSHDPISAALQDSFLALAKATKNGATQSKSVPLASLFSHYPLYADVSLPLGSFPSLSPKEQREQQREFQEAFSWIFPFPVLDDHMVTLSVTLDQEGNLTDAEMRNSANPPSVQFKTCSLLTDQDLFFTLEARGRSGELLDYRQSALGYGIYRLPYAECSLSADTLDLFFPLEAGQHPQILRANGDESLLLLCSSSDQENTLQIFDSKSGVEVQRLPTGQKDLRDLLIGDGCALLLYADESFTLLVQNDKGLYEEAFTGQLPASAEFSLGINWENAIAYDGERLALMGLEPWVGERSVGYCSPCLAIYSKEGLLYAGTYRCSLDASTVPPMDQDQWDHNDFCRLNPPQPLGLSWKE